MIEGTSPDRARLILRVTVLVLALLAPLRLEGQDPVRTTQEPQDTIQAQEPQDDRILRLDFFDWIFRASLENP